MSIRESSYGYWSSQTNFLLVACGAVIGIGNVARLPYLMSEYGGLVFLVFYVAALLLVSLPLLTTEWMLGRWMRNDLVNGFIALAKSAGARREWAIIGFLSLISAILILSFYSVIAGWSAAYAIRSTAGIMGGMPEENARALFLTLAQDPERGLSWHTIFMVFTAIIVAHGFKDGIQHAARRLVPTALVLATFVFFYAITHSNTDATLRALLAPDLSKFGWRGALEAIQQAFFTLALGMGSMMAIGSYLPSDAPLKKLALTVIAVDTVFSLMVGFAVFTLAHQARIEPVAGLAMLFEVLPRSLPAGTTLVLVAFYLMLFLITLAAAITLLEGVTRLHMDWQRHTRVFAAVMAAFFIWFLGIGTLLSFGVLQEVRWLGRNFFEWLQLLTAGIITPLTGLLLCIFSSRIMPKEMSERAFGHTEAGWYPIWIWCLRYPTRIALILLLTYSMGLLGWLARLWNL